MTWYRTIAYMIALALLSSCGLGRSSIDRSGLNTKNYFPYTFEQCAVYELSPELVEVSGLCHDYTSDKMVAVQDEDGVIYTIDEQSGQIIQRDTFRKAGDYEGIALTKEHIYILKSSGTLYKMNRADLSQKPSKIKTPLTKNFDVEGLEYDMKTNSLLLCNKNYTAPETQNQRLVYRFDLAKNKLQEEPYLVIDRTEILAFLKENHPDDYINEKFKKIANPTLDYLHLGPSGIAVHPLTGDVFIISSQSKVLLVFDGVTKQLSAVKKLDKKLFPQPEGICFDAKGKLYISSEGKKSSAKLIVMPMNDLKVSAKR